MFSNFNKFKPIFVVLFVVAVLVISVIVIWQSKSPQNTPTGQNLKSDTRINPVNQNFETVAVPEIKTNSTSQMTPTQPAASTSTSNSNIQSNQPVDDGWKPVIKGQVSDPSKAEG
jgi:cytoskeletal protein RodZ